MKRRNYLDNRTALEEEQCALYLVPVYSTVQYMHMENYNSPLTAKLIIVRSLR